MFINTGELLSVWTNNFYPALVCDNRVWSLCVIKVNENVSHFISESSRGNSRKFRCLHERSSFDRFLRASRQFNTNCANR